MAAVALGVGICATLALAGGLPVPPEARFGIVVLTVGAGGMAARGTFGRGRPVLLHVGIDRRLCVTTRDGRSCEGTILDVSYVGARLTTIVWRPEGAARLCPAHALLILCDSLPAEDFRRLRVCLRYGRPVVLASPAAPSIGVAAPP
jgi:hypothetical protein